MTRAALLLLASALLGPSPAMAFGIVTACNTDVEQGAGLNLADAITRGGTIGFNCGFRTIRITRTHRIEQFLDIDGEGRVALAADPNVAMFYAAPSARVVTLRNIELTGGRQVRFGAIFDGPGVELELTNVNVHDAGFSHGPVFGFAGGMVINANKLEVDDSYFTNNAGAVLIAPVLELRNSHFSGNSGQPFMPHFVDEGGTAVIEDSTFSGNGVAVWRGDIQIRRCEFSRNHSSPAGYGGALTFRGKAQVEKTTFSRNTAVNGGAIWFSAGEMTLRRVNFEKNAASGEGGAIGVAAGVAAPYWDATISIRHSHFRDNRALRGGAIAFLPTGVPRRSLDGYAVNFARNVATENGGAIAADNAMVDFVRAQFVDNRAGSAGGALHIASGSTRLANVLAVRNTATSGSVFSGRRLETINASLADNNGLALDLLSPDATARLSNTILLRNVGGNCRAPSGSGGRIEDGGQNIQFPGTECGSSIASGDPGLDSLYVPVPNSRARFAGNQAVCAAAPISNRDVFNASRPQARDRCTIGAIERTLEPQAIDKLRHSEKAVGPLADFLKVLDRARHRE